MNIIISWEWATHQPLIHLMMSEFHPELVVELGMGINSTPVFLQYSPKQYIGIENDKEWLDLVKQQFVFLPEYQLLFHDLEDSTIDLTTKVRFIAEEVKVKSFEYYVQLRKQIEGIKAYPKLLFVDHFTGLRTLAIKTLYESFDIILYHDCQPEGIPWYSYYFDDIMFEKYNHLVLKSSNSWTGCFLSNKLVYEEEDLKKRIRPFVHQFCESNKIDENKMYLDNSY